MSSPRFLFSSVSLPWPPDQGSKRFTLELARGLHALGVVTWISRATEGYAVAQRVLEEEGFRIRLDESWADQSLVARASRRVKGEWQALRHNLPRVSTYACTSTMQYLLEEELRAHPESIVVGAYWFEAPAVRTGPDGRRVLVLADLEYHSLAEKLGRDPEGPLPPHAERLRRAEKDALMSCDALLCITEEDRRLAERALEDIPYALHPKLGVWPAVIPVPESTPDLRKREPGRSQRWLIYGHWSAEFNRDGLRSFISKVWPALRREVPAPPELCVAGAGLDPGLGRLLESHGAEVLGWVEDLASELDRCDAVVVPLDYAGGLRYRMLEAMAAGRPVLCTPVAARGSEAVAGEHYLAASSVREWADAWSELEDEDVAAHIARNGHQFVRHRYGASSRARRVREVLTETLGPTLGSSIGSSAGSESGSEEQAE